MTWPINILINTLQGDMDLDLHKGDIILITGPNGVGKSSLLHEISRVQNGYHKFEILPGHRQINFSSDDVDQIGMSVEQLDQNIRSAPMAFNRYRGHYGEMHLKSFVKRASAKEAQINAQVTEMARESQSSAKFVRENPGIIRTINNIFAVSKLEVKIILIDGLMKATRDGNVYQIDRLSDGERAALLVVLAILSQEKDGVLVIDEPERHLNRAIYGPLISSAFRSRPDLNFIVASHALDIIEWIRPSKILHLKGSKTLPPVDSHFENRIYDVEVVEDDGVPVDIKQSILGVKDRVLFVEGDTLSDDRLLYAKVYAATNIVAKGGWETVVNHVRVLRESEKYTWLSVCGLIDTDGRDEHEVEELLKDKIYCIECPTIENLFLLENVLSEMADQHFKLNGGKVKDQRMSEARDTMLEILNRHKRDIVYKRSLWIINRLISQKKVSLKELARGKENISGLLLHPIFLGQFAKFEALVDQNVGLSLLSSLPLKNTGIPNAMAKAIGYVDFKQLKQAIFKQIDDGGTVGVALLAEFRTRLPDLSTI